MKVEGRILSGKSSLKGGVVLKSLKIADALELQNRSSAPLFSLINAWCTLVRANFLFYFNHDLGKDS